MRKAILNRQREQKFDNSYRANDQPLPSYNALEDPYLSGFFEKPQLKRHLKDMHLIKVKRKARSHTKRPNTTSRTNAEVKNDFKLPLLDDILGQKESSNHRRDIRTAGSSQRKRKSVYKSKQDS